MRELKFVKTYTQIVSQTCDVVLNEEEILTFGHLEMLCKIKQITNIVTTSMGILKLFFPPIEGTATESIGCRYTRNGLHVTMIPPLSQIHTVKASNFLHRHFIDKFINPQHYIAKDTFRYTFVTAANLALVKARMNTALLIAVDIETVKEPMRRMTSVAYTALFKDGSTMSYVIPHTPDSYPFCLDATRVLNLTTPPKVMQNGMYDSLYFVTFNAPLYNYVYDTYHLMHSLYPELPKTLHWISGMFITNYQFWKDESKSDLYQYNAKDTHNTLFAFLGLLRYIKRYKYTYASRNYAEEFSNVWPALSCDLEGVLIDPAEQTRVRALAVAERDAAQQRLNTLIGQPINCNSPKQVLSLMKLFDPKLTKTGEKELQRSAETVPLVGRLMECILKVREKAKAISTYFDVELWQGRLFFHLDPGGTDTTRFASKSSGYWCGTQIQNIPSYAKSMIVFEDGWIAGAVDKAQSEAYCTGYLSRDTALKHAVNTSPDFHCHNASMFFGIPVDKLFDAATGKKLNKAIRDIAKRVNHGANYNMGAAILWATMGTREVMESARVLNLPPNWTPYRICEYLLNTFDKTYPRVRGEFQKEVVKEVMTTGFISLPTGHKRRTFLQPWNNKPDLNSAVASKPQGLSVQLVNKAMRRIFWQLQHDKFVQKFRLKMQVHDEVVFIALPDVFEEAIQRVMDLMIVPISIHGDIMKIPSSRAQGHRWSELKD